MRHETNSNSLTIQGTENGYLSKTILKGKTLNNIWGAKGFQINGDNVTIFQDGRIKHTSKANRYSNAFDTNLDMLKTDTDYTIIAFVYINEFKNGRIHINNPSGETQGAFTTPIIIQSGETGTFMNKIRTRESFDRLTDNVGLRSFFDNEVGEVGKNVELQILVLEGDYTQSPPSYFEGLNSVGDGVEDIEITSIKSDGNLFDGKFIEGKSILGTDGSIVNSRERVISANTIKVNQGEKIYFKVNSSQAGETTIRELYFYDDNNIFLGKQSSYIKDSVLTMQYTGNLRFSVLCMGENATESKVDINLVKITIVKSDTPVQHQPYKQDKKLLLFKDKDGIWKKPIIRGVDENNCDVIEELEGGKVRYTKRYGEVTLNGDEGWSADSSKWNDATVKPFVANAIPNAKVDGNNINIFCDSFKPFNIYADTHTVEGIYYSVGLNIHVRIFRSKLSTQDLKGIKDWLKSNPITIVYELAQEEVYECTPIATASYKIETTLNIFSGAICPLTSLETDYTLANAVGRVKDIKVFNQAILDNKQAEYQNLVDGNQSLVDSGVIQINNLLNKINS